MTNLTIGDRVVVPFTISCGQCWFCQPGAVLVLRHRPVRMPTWRSRRMGHSPAGPVRLPPHAWGLQRRPGRVSARTDGGCRADQGPRQSFRRTVPVPDSDIFPTGYMAAENAQIKDGDTVAIWGCGPVGQFAIRSALMMGAGRVIAIDQGPRAAGDGRGRRRRNDQFLEGRCLRRARWRATSGVPTAASTRIGCEASGHGSADAVLGQGEGDHERSPPTGCASCARPSSSLPQGRARTSSPACDVGIGDKIPLGAAMNKGLTFEIGQTHVQRSHEAASGEGRAAAGSIQAFSWRTRPELEDCARDCTRSSGPTRKTASSRWCCDPRNKKGRGPHRGSKPARACPPRRQVGAALGTPCSSTATPRQRAAM